MVLACKRGLPMLHLGSSVWRSVRFDVVVSGRTIMIFYVLNSGQTIMQIGREQLREPLPSLGF